VAAVADTAEIDTNNAITKSIERKNGIFRVVFLI